MVLHFLKNVCPTFYNIDDTVVSVLIITEPQ